MRITSIDFLRGVAVLLVVFRHITLEPILSNMGWVGVDLFFVLSGFLVSNLLFQEYKETQTIKPIRFLIRRGFKIYPLFYLMIFLVFFIELNRQPQYYDIYKSRLFNEVLFIQNYNYDVTLIGHTWSLAVEEHFYFALAILFFILAKLKVLDNKILFNSLTAIILFLCLNMRINIVLPLEKFDYSQYLIPTHLRFDTLWVGVFIAYHYNYNSEKFKNTFAKGGWLWLILLALAIPVCYGIDNKFLATFGLTFIALSFGATLAALVADDKSEALLNTIFGKRVVKGFAKIGTYSYGIYLFHMAVRWYVGAQPEPAYNSLAGRWNMLVQLTVLLFIGILATELIEKPLLKWRNKIMKPQQPPK